MSEIEIVNDVREYYSEKVTQFGSTPKGVDWNGKDSQFLRFEQLCKIIGSPSEEFFINDLGCGYGALVEFLVEYFKGFRYSGFDISEEMIREAREKYHDTENASWFVGGEIGAVADYSVASGVFNVRLQHSDDEWFEYIKLILDSLYEHSSKGFSFNCLSLYSDVSLRRENLYYADPSVFFDLCKKRYSKNVAVLHDYNLYEFTMLVRA